MLEPGDRELTGQDSIQTWEMSSEEGNLLLIYKFECCQLAGAEAFCGGVQPVDGNPTERTYILTSLSPAPLMTHVCVGQWSNPRGNQREMEPTEVAPTGQSPGTELGGEGGRVGLEQQVEDAQHGGQS